MSDIVVATGQAITASSVGLITSPAEARRQHQELSAFIADVMVKGLDFGLIPGVKKPCIFQPGAQKLLRFYGLSVEFFDDGSQFDWEKPFFFVRKRATVKSRRVGDIVCTGLGSCNSREDRYAWRWAWDLPKGVDPNSVKTRTTQNNKTQYRLPNDDIFSLVNTIEKMAAKRALVHAALVATGATDIFSQDHEGLPDEVFGQVEESRSWEQKAAPVESPASPPASPPPPDPIGKELFQLLMTATSAAELEQVGLRIRKAVEEKRIDGTHRDELLHVYRARKKELAPPSAEPAQQVTEDGEVVQ